MKEKQQYNFSFVYLNKFLIISDYVIKNNFFDINFQKIKNSN